MKDPRLWTLLCMQHLNILAITTPGSIKINLKARVFNILERPQFPDRRPNTTITTIKNSNYYPPAISGTDI